MSTPDETGADRNPDSGPGERGALDDDEMTRKDVSYSPASERETAAKQRDPIPDGIDAEIDTSRIRAVPGTGGPDDAGDVDLDRHELGALSNEGRDGSEVTSASEGDPMDDSTPVDNLE